MLYRRLTEITRWVREQRLGGIAYQIKKRAILEVYRRTDAWQRLERCVRSFWTPHRVSRWTGDLQAGRFLLGPSRGAAFASWARDHVESANAIREWAASIVHGRIDIFDRVYSMSWGNMPWLEDWRSGVSWPAAYFRSARQDVASHKRGEIKFPWELSRMNWLIPLCEATLLTGEARFRTCIKDGVERWERANPTAYSANWHPMECAMRILNLSWAAMMLGLDPATRPDDLAPLLRQITLQAEFLWRNVEYGRLRNNHYAANLAGLAVAGHVLSEYWPSARRWLAYAAKRTFPEILNQFCPDGVQFEGSIPYHRLVTELFLVTALVLQRENTPVPPEAARRLRNAAFFTASYIRPDGLAPAWGDNDSARVLGFDKLPIADHRPLAGLAANLFGDPRIDTPGQAWAAEAWLADATLWPMEESDLSAEIRILDAHTRYFPHAGIVISRSGGSYLLADYGEVGFRGLGGHGHNDTFSFELCLAGQPVIVDPGSPSYTGNTELYERYRSTAAHNVLEIDGEEMAPMTGRWRIGNHARPYDVTVTSRDRTMVIAGTHSGYSRLSDPVVHRRVLEFSPIAGEMICTDEIRCTGTHEVRRHIHLAPEVAVEGITSDSVGLLLPHGHRVVMHWGKQAIATITDGAVSPVFGAEIPARVISLRQTIRGTTQLQFSVREA